MNWGRLLYGWDDPRVAEFVDNLDLVNSVAARAPGFVWRLSDDDMDFAQNDPSGVFSGDPLVASTLSVWESVDALRAFVFQTVHAKFMSKARLWQEELSEVTYVIWPIIPGHIPTMAEAKMRLNWLAENGPSESAFDFAYAKDNSL